jgi:hypothetical protein
MAASRELLPATASATLPARMVPGCVDTGHTAVRHANANHFAILDNVDAATVRAARISPHHRVMARRSTAALQQSPMNGETGIVKIEIRRERAQLLDIEKLGIDAVQPHRIAAPGEGVALLVRVIEIEDPALAHHDVVVELALEPLPQLQRKLIERYVAGQQIIGSDDRRIPAGIAGTDPVFFEHGGVG